MPEHILKSREAQQRQIADWEESQKILKRYPDVKRRWEALTEALTNKQEQQEMPTDSKERSAVSYFESCKVSIEQKIADQDARLKKIQEEVQAAKVSLYKKLVFVEERLSAATKRMETLQQKASPKSREQILLEKEITEMVEKFQKLQPDISVQSSFPGIEHLGIKMSNLLVAAPAPAYIPPPPRVYISPQDSSEETPETTPENLPVASLTPEVKKKRGRAPKTKTESETSSVPEVAPLPPPAPPLTVSSDHPDTIPEQHPLGYHYNRMSEEEKAFFFTSRPDVFANLRAMEDYVEPPQPQPPPSQPFFQPYNNTPRVLSNTKRLLVK